MAKKEKRIEAPIIEDIHPTTLDDLMGDRFDIYAKDVIQDRAIPDARDGMKPVQRRIIYAMWKAGNTIEKQTKKCAHIVGDVMGNYHPHGDSSIYEALVRMSQEWRVRLPLIDFQGNKGSMDGDGPAAYRYTEARLAAVSQELIRDIEKDTVDMGLTFDDTNFEPTVLPARFPNMLVNGASGIAVGIATHIPPHNLKEVTAAIVHRIQHPNCPIESLMKFVPGPDFPTGGILFESSGLKDIYLKGNGRVEIAAKTEIVENKDGSSQIIVTEIPYEVVKSTLVYEIDKIRHNKTIDGIEEVRDETDKTGLRIAIDIRKGFKPEAVLGFLFSKTPLRTSYSANMVAIVHGRPTTVNLLTYCDTYIDHQVDVIIRRSRYNLAKDEARLEVVQGLIKANSIINEVVDIIRKSEDKADSKINLQNAFGFTPNQSEAIVMMPLYKLSHTDIDVLIREEAALKADIAELNLILTSEEKRNALIIEDLRRVAKTYGDDRRTLIQEDSNEHKNIDRRDLIAKEDVMVVVTRDGYVKRSSLASWKGSGGNNGVAPGLKSGDTLIYSGKASVTDYMLMFTNKGQYLYVPIHLLKANKWLEEGQHVNYAVSLSPGEKIVKAFAVTTFRSDLNIAMVSRRGQIKRSKLSDFPVSRFNRPVKTMKLLGDDEVIDVTLTSGNSTLCLVSEDGFAIAYNENMVPLTTSASGGVKAASFKGAFVAGLTAFYPEEKNGKILLITQFAHTRVASLSNINFGERTSKKVTQLFKCFKSEAHHVIFVDAVGGKPSPFTYQATQKDGKVGSVSFESWNLTPMDKYAKAPSPSATKNRLENIWRADDLVVTKQIVACEPPVIEEEEEAEEEVRALPREDDKPAERFEQISIFGDDEE